VLKITYTKVIHTSVMKLGRNHYLNTVWAS
jgi:hypothetical protein